MIEPDAADRLILDESAAAREGVDDIVVIGDETGALTLALATADGVRVRTHQDSVSAERALGRAAAAAGAQDCVTSLPLGRDLVADARVVLVRLPRAHAALADIAAVIAADAAPQAVVFAGGRVKHMSLGMNDILRERFETLDITHARQKSRVLVARRPRGDAAPAPVCESLRLPRLSEPVTVCAYGGAFAGASLDIGTRMLLEHLPDAVPTRARAIDLACGTGLVATWLALRNPALRVLATDQSAIAVASARATAGANDVSARVDVVRDDALSLQPDASAAFIALNPPFHDGAAVDESLAHHLFVDAARVLASGGELWCVWNSHLRYRPALERLVGPTRQIARNPKFTVTASTAA